MDAAVLGWLLGLSFLAFGVWTLVPDRAETPAEDRRWGPLLTTAVVFFFAEMGDKTSSRRSPSARASRRRARSPRGRTGHARRWTGRLRMSPRGPRPHAARFAAWPPRAGLA